MNEPLIKTKALYSLIDLEPFVILSSLLILAWFFYHLFLKGVSPERHVSIRRHFSGIFRNFVILACLFFSFAVVAQLTGGDGPLGRSLPYLGILTLVWGGIVFVKVSRLIVLMYLFLGSMQAGVPLLIVNIFSLALSMVLVLWAGSHVFGLELAPLLATSAALSIVLGLALQDTLGNLFAGISLQVDKSFEIGEWLEIQHAGHKFVGQVKEITWRATTLLGWHDETIIIPNRQMASVIISNFRAGESPLFRSQTFRLEYGTDVDLAKKCLLDAVQKVSGVRLSPSPICLAVESHESWLTIRLSYAIDNYGSQFSIADQVLNLAIKALHDHGIQTTVPAIRLISHTPPPNTSMSLPL